MCWASLQRRKKPRRPRSLSHGYWPRNRGSFPFRERRSCIVLRKILAQRASRLHPDDLGQIENVASGVAVQGARYPAELQKLVGR